jgi:hypothetical protein
LLLIVARDQNQKQNGLERIETSLQSVVIILLLSAKPPERSRLWLCRCDRITNHESLLTNHPSTRQRLLRAGLSLLTSLSDIALATSDHGRASGLTVRLQNLILILSQCIDLGLLAVTAPFRAARHLKKILGSGFEMIRISQCELARVFGFYDKERATLRSN